MRWGFPWSVPWGEHEEFVEWMTIDDLGDGPRIRFNPRDGYEQYYQLQIDGVFQGSAFFARYGYHNEVVGVWQSPDSVHVVSLVPIGDYAEKWNLWHQQRDFQSARADRVAVAASTVPAVLAYSESGQLTGWSLAGVKRFTNCYPAEFRPTWGMLDCSLTDAGGTRTVVLSMRGLTVAQGSRVGDGAITLAEANDSGISGSVTVAYTGDAPAAKVVIRFPAKVRFHYKTSQFTAPNFPRTAEGEIFDDGYSNAFTFRSAKLAAGTYYVVSHQVDEDGNESSGLFAGGDSLAIVAPPEPPTSLAYASGDSTNTVVQWTASATSGATYNIYDSLDGLEMDLSTPNHTHIAGAGTLTQALASIGAGFAGKRYILVRAVKTGVEEGNMAILEIEYVSGARVAPRPNAPLIGRDITVSGRTLTIPVVIDITNQKAATATVKLFVYAPGGSPNYAAPDATATVGTAMGSLITTNAAKTRLVLTYAAGSDMTRLCQIRSVTAGGVQSENTEVYGPFRLTTEAFPDPTQEASGGF